MLQAWSHKESDIEWPNWMVVETSRSSKRKSTKQWGFSLRISSPYPDVFKVLPKGYWAFRLCGFSVPALSFQALIFWTQTPINLALISEIWANTMIVNDFNIKWNVKCYQAIGWRIVLFKINLSNDIKKNRFELGNDWALGITTERWRKSEHESYQDGGRGYI